MKKRYKALDFLKGRNRSVTYDYSNTLSREDTIDALFDIAKKNKNTINAYWKRMRSYYDGDHAIASTNGIFAQNCQVDFDAAQTTDGYIHVETQIEAALPDFEFSPTGEDDYEKAKQREDVVRYVCSVNNIEEKNAMNERRLNILGSAVYKICWDASERNNKPGEVFIDNPRPSQIFTDPSSTTVDGCEYIAYVYRMHKLCAKRIFGAEIAARGLHFEDFCDRFNPMDYEEDFDFSTISDDDTVTVTEWWFRQPEDGECTVESLVDGELVDIKYKWRSGDIALCVLIGGKEVRYIPKYWNNTSFDKYPFVIYTKVPNEDSIWGKSELEMIIPLIDAADRELAFAQFNSAFSSNDIILAEENALSDECNLENSPGAVWKLRPGMMGKVQRLGNIAYSEQTLYGNSLNWRSMMQETTGNFDMYQGREPERVTTATGIALLNERSKSRQALKSVNKKSGFKRFYELIDITALEHYDDGRVVYIGAAEKKNLVFSFGDFVKHENGKNDYVPVLDVKIHVGDGLTNSRAFTISAITDLIRTPINEENYLIVKAFLEAIDIPMRKELCDMLDERFAKKEEKEAGVPKADVGALPAMPQLM